MNLKNIINERRFRDAIETNMSKPAED